MAFIKKTPSSLSVISAIFILFSSGVLAQKIEVKDPKIEITIQKTPRYSPNGPKEKRDTQKFWIEVEVGFKADQKGKPDEEHIAQLEFKYYITIKPKDPKNRKVYTLSLTHVNIPKDEGIYSVAYMSPTTIAKIIGKSKMPSKSDIDVAVEIRSQGTLIAGDKTTSGSKKWWTELPQAEGLVLDKTKTPFAPLWWDRYAEVQGR